MARFPQFSLPPLAHTRMLKRNMTENKVTMTKEEKPDITGKKHDKRRDLPQIFKKGVSGNPAGRPKGSFSITTKITKLLENNPEMLADVVEDIFKKHPDLVWKMIDGMPKQAVEFDGEMTHKFEDLSDEQLEARVKAEQNKLLGTSEGEGA